eukprot:COSAG01_NODE_22722_length_844_cov_1.032215_1_plen_225_part_00
MILRGPGIPEGQNFSQIASNVDVAPTLLSLAGIDPVGISDPPMDGKSLVPWLLSPKIAKESLRELPGTWVQLNRERARGAAPPELVRDRHWVEFYSLGSFGCCGGGTCTADKPDHTGSGSLDGMRCGAGRSSPGHPTHMVDSTESNTYRALRFVSPLYGNKLYAEFTAVQDWNFTSPDIFIEVFNLDDDPGQLDNLVNLTSAEELAYYRSETRAQFTCVGAACK